MAKRNWSRWLASTLMLSAALLPLPGAGMAAGFGNLIVNGGFEQPQIGGGYQIYGSIPGWTTASGCGIEIQHRTAGSPYMGDQHVELDSNCSSSMYQDVTTGVARKYALQFAYSPRPGVADNHIKVYWDGQEVADLNRSGVGLTDTNWQIVTIGVASFSSNHRLTFSDVGPSDSLGGYIDEVSLSPAY